MRNYSRSKFLLIPLLLCVSFLAHAENSYSKVFMFGDSLSDTGNIASVFGQLPAPYYKNRLTNGPVAVDTLTAKLGDTAESSLHLIGPSVGHNYSVAGASASGNEGIDLDTQVISFQANHGYVAPSDALYVIFIGGNDIRAALYEPDLIIAETIIKNAKNKIRDAIKTLKQAGARSFYVIGTPDIALIPETSLMAAALNNPDLLTRASYLSKRFNRKLHRMIERLEDNHGINVSEFKLAKLFAKVLDDSTSLGFTNKTDACFSSVTYTFHPDCNYGLNIDKFVFFDEIHPTARVHAMFGEAFYKELIED